MRKKECLGWQKVTHWWTTEASRCQLSRRRGWDSPSSKTDHLLLRNESTAMARCWICPSNRTAASFLCCLNCSFKPKLHFAMYFNTTEATKTSESLLFSLPHLYYVLVLSPRKGKRICALWCHALLQTLQNTLQDSLTCLNKCILM